MSHAVVFLGICWDIRPSSPIAAIMKAVSMLFTNEFEHTLDDKGRVSLPIKHREQIGDMVVLGRGSRGQVHVLPTVLHRSMIERAEQALAEGRDDESLALLLSYVPAEIDRQGRIVIPAGLRRHAKLATDVTIAGQGDHIEIWDRDAWQKRWDDMVADKKIAAAKRAQEAIQSPEQAREPLFSNL